ncbi:MAG: aminotransferase class V-fold PLP-dependent enzyme, partial [Bacteroidota bacterium]
YPIYVCKLTLEWIKEMGGLDAMAKRNQEKADLIYDAIDRLPLFQGTAATEDRSKMNACFVIEDEELTKEFLQLCTENGCSGVKGHRSVGGFRASMYNAMEKESVQLLVDLMEDFAQKRG